MTDQAAGRVFDAFDGRIVSFDRAAASEYAFLFAAYRRQGKEVGTIDNTNRRYLEDQRCHARDPQQTQIRPRRRAEPRSVAAMISRRAFLASISLIGTAPMPTDAQAAILSAPLQLAGDWRQSLPGDVSAVLTRMRAACLDGVPLRSDRQPTALRVVDNTSGPPHIWLHTDEPTTAIIAVDVGTQDWCNLAYQFGHELGHVIANSWQWNDKPRNPTQWLEEAVVESFSVRGLARLADSWEQSPPFPRDNAYSNAIRDYRERLLAPDRAQAHDQGGDAGLAAWFAARADYLATHGGIDAAKPAVPAVVKLLEASNDVLADLGAMNRWPERTGIPLADYLDRWEASCVELDLSGILPRRLREVLRVER